MTKHKNHYKATPIKLIVEILTLSPKNFMKVILRNNITGIPDEEIISRLCYGSSLVRWGDGETALARGKFIWFQRQDPNLGLKLKEILRQENPNLQVCIPIKVINSSSFSYIGKRRYNFWKEFSSRVFFARYLNRNNKNFGDSGIWYRNSGMLFEILSKIVNNRNVLLIGSEERIADHMREIGFSTSFLKVPDRDAYDEYPRILNEVQEWTRALLHGAKGIVISVAGPVGKVLALELASEQQVLDIGHGILLNLDGEFKIVKY